MKFPIKHSIAATVFLLLVAIRVSGQFNETYTLNYSVSNVSCPGDTDGSINISSFSCIDETSGNTGCFDVNGVTVPDYCSTVADIELDAFSGQSVTLENGKTGKVVSNYDGYVNFNGGTLIICGHANIPYINLGNPSKIIVIGELYANGINSNGFNVELINYGTVEVSQNLNIQGSVVNYGTISSMQGANFNSIGEFQNYGSFIVSGGNFIVNSGSKLYNHNSITLSNDFILNSNSQFYNYCAISGAVNLTVDAGSVFSNYALFSISNILTLNSASDFVCHNGSQVTCGVLNLSASTISNPENQCSLFKIVQNIGIQNTSAFDGQISLCLPDNSQLNTSAVNLLNGASLNCECSDLVDPTIPVSDLTDFSIVWSDGNTADFARTGLAPGMYAATITGETCEAPVALDFVVAEPTALSFTSNVLPATCDGLSDGAFYIAVQGGVPPYTVLANGAEGNAHENIPAGEYSVQITDAKGCSTSGSVQVPTLDPPTVNFIYDRDMCWGEIDENNPLTVKVELEDVNLDQYALGGNCSVPVEGHPYDISTATVIDNSLSYIELQTGQSYLLNKNFNGLIKINGAYLFIDNDVNIDYLVLENDDDKVIVIGSLNTNSINFNNTSAALENYGTINMLNSSLSIGGAFINYGDLNVKYDLNINSGAQFVNKGAVHVGSNLNNNHEFENYGNIDISSSLHLNSNTSTSNYCTITVGNRSVFNASAQFDNYRIFTIHNEIIFNSNTVLRVHPGSIFSANDGIINDIGVIFQNPDPSCSRISFEDRLLVNNPLTIDGNVNLCSISGTIENESQIAYTNGALLGCQCNPYEIGNIFSWSDGTESDEIQITHEGRYDVTFTLGECTYTETLNIDFPDEPVITPVVKDDSCLQVLNSGSISLDIPSDEPISAIKWYNNLGHLIASQTNGIGGIGAGTYTYEILYETECVFTNTVSVAQLDGLCDPEIQEVCSLDVSLTQIPEKCSGDKNGVLYANVEDVPFEAIWTTPSGNRYLGNRFDAIEYGDYNVQVQYIIDDVVCAFYDVVTVAQKAGLPSEIDYEVTDSDQDKSTGSIQITETGITNPHYRWENSISTHSRLSGLLPGIYNLTITDADNCSADYSITVDKTNHPDQCDSYNINFVYRDPLCAESDDILTNGGSISIVERINDVSAVTWYKDGVEFEVGDGRIINLTAAQYEVHYNFILEDGTEGCAKSDIINLYAPDSIVVKPTVRKPTWQNSVNGKITIDVESGGTSPYTYAWTKPGEDDFTQGNSFLSGIGIGNYKARVTDNNRCISVVEIPLVSAFTPVGPQPICPGSPGCGDDPSCENCIVCDPEVAECPQIVDYPDNFPVIIPDSIVGPTVVCETDNGNMVTVSNAITTHCAEIGLSVMFNYEDCYSTIVPSVELTASDGDLYSSVTGFEINWYDENCDQIVDNLEADKLYSVVAHYVYNGEVCVASEILTTTVDDKDLSVHDIVSPIACEEDLGEVNFVSKDLQMPYTIDWNGTESTSLIYQNLEQGSSYNYVITNNDGCQKSGVIDIPVNSSVCDKCEKSEISISSKDVNCFGQHNGYAIASIQTDLSVVNQYWENSRTLEQTAGNILTGAKAGIYTFYTELVDPATGEQCNKSKIVTISEPEKISFSTIDIEPDFADSKIGSINVSVIGGTGIYTYIWDEYPSVNASVINSLQGGVNYYFTVKDELYCEKSEIFYVPISDIPVDTCDLVNFNYSVKNGTCESKYGEINIFNVANATEYQFKIYDEDGSVLDNFDENGFQKFSNLESGDYEVALETIIDGEMCRIGYPVEIRNTDLPEVKFSVGNEDDSDCKVAVQAFSVSGLVQLDYQWSDDVVGQTFYASGPVTVTVTSPEYPGCQDVYTVPVENALPAGRTCNYSINITSSRNGNCNFGNPEYQFSLLTENVDETTSIVWYLNGAIIGRDVETITVSTPGIYTAKVEFVAEREHKIYDDFIEIINVRPDYNYSLSTSGYDCESQDDVEVKLIANNRNQISTNWEVYTNGEITASYSGTNTILIPRQSKPAKSIAYITDVYGCSDKESAEVTFSDEACICSSLEPSILVTPFKCQWSDNASLRFIVANGNARVENVVWTLDDVLYEEGNPSISGLDQEGTYIASALVIYADDDGNETTCDDIKVRTNLKKPDSLDVEGVSYVAPSCAGQADGKAFIHTSGGTGFISIYENEVLVSGTSFTSGTHNLVLEDSKGCQHPYTVEVPISNTVCPTGYSMVVRGPINVCGSVDDIDLPITVDVKDPDGNFVPLASLESVVWTSVCGDVIATDVLALTEEQVRDHIINMQNMDIPSPSVRTDCEATVQRCNDEMRWYFNVEATFLVDGIAKTVSSSKYISLYRSSISLNPTVKTTSYGASTGSIKLNPTSDNPFDAFYRFSIVHLDDANHIATEYAQDQNYAYGLPAGKYLIAASNVGGCVAVDSVVIDSVGIDDKCAKFSVNVDTKDPSNIDYTSGEIHIEIVDPTGYSGTYTTILKSDSFDTDGEEGLDFDDLSSGTYMFTIFQNGSPSCGITEPIYLIRKLDDDVPPIPDTDIHSRDRCTYPVDIADAAGVDGLALLTCDDCVDENGNPDEQETDEFVRSICSYYESGDKIVPNGTEIPLGDHDLYIGCSFNGTPTTAQAMLDAMWRSQFESQFRGLNLYYISRLGNSYLKFLMRRSYEEFMADYVVRNNTLFWETSVVPGGELGEFVWLNIMDDMNACAGNEIQIYADGMGTFSWHKFEGVYDTPPVALSAENYFSSENEPFDVPSATTTYFVDYAPDVEIIRQIYNVEGAELDAKVDECSSVQKVVVQTESIIDDGTLVRDIQLCAGTEHVLDIQNHYSVSTGTNLTYHWDQNSDIDYGVEYVEYEYGMVPDEWLDYVRGYDATVDEVLSNSFVNIIATTNNTFSFTVSSENGCQLTDEINVAVGSGTSLALPEEIVLCYDEAYQFSVPQDGIVSWNPAHGLSDASIHDPMFTGNESTRYIVSLEDEFGCGSADTVDVTVLPVPTPEVQINGSACLEGDNVEISGEPGFSYLWGPATAVQNDIVDAETAVYSYRLSNTAYVTVTDEHNCFVELDFPLYQKLTITPSDINDLCLGQTAELSTEDGFQYDWSPSNGIIGENVNNPIIQPIADITYTVTGEDPYGCTISESVTVKVDQSCECFNVDFDLPGQKTYFWRSGLSTAVPQADCDRSWFNVKNWSLDRYEHVIPKTPPTTVDNVIVGDYINSDETVDFTTDITQLKVLSLGSNVIINNLCIIDREVSLSNGATILAQNNGTFTGGIVTATDENCAIVVDGKEYNKYNKAIFAGTEFHCLVSVVNTEDIALNGSEFHLSALFERTGEENIVSSGGNTYHSDVTIRNLGQGDFTLSSYPPIAGMDARSDVYEGTAVLESSEASLHVSSVNTDLFKSDIFVSGELVDFGLQGGGVSICGDKLQNIQTVDGSRDETISIYSLSIEQAIVSNSSGLNVLVGIYIPGQIDYDNRLDLTKGIVNTYRSSVITVGLGAEIFNASQQSFINGPLCIIGNGTLSYPIGKGDRLMPLVLNNVTGTTEGYLCEFIQDDPHYIDNEQANILDLEYLSECEYWRILHGAFDSGITPVLSWDNRSCEIPIDLTKLLVASYESDTWVSKGNGDYTGSRTTGGTISNDIEEFPLNEIRAFALGSSVAPGAESPTGFSFNIYGANVEIGQAENLIVYGNVHNENGGSGDNVVPTIESRGNIFVKKDWTNNSTDVVFEDIVAGNTSSSGGGYVNLFGENQRLRGTHKTIFHQLDAAGNGKKSMYQHIDVDQSGYLNLNDNQVETREYILSILNTDPVASLYRNQIGFVSSKEGGYLNRFMNPVAASDYFYPIGEPSLFRPISLKPKATGTDALDYGARMVGHNPLFDGFDPSHRSPFTEGINDKYYHLITYGLTDGLETNIASPVPVDLKMFFDKNEEDYFQSISNWSLFNGTVTIEKDGNVLGEALLPIIEDESYTADNTIEVWQPLYNTVADLTDVQVPSAGTAVASIDNTPSHTVVCAAVDDFEYKPFALGKKGFQLITNDYGDPDGNGTNVAYSLTGDPVVNGAPIYITNTANTDNGTVNSGQLLSPDMYVLKQDGDRYYAEITFDASVESQKAILRFDVNQDGVIQLDGNDGSETVKYVLEKVLPNGTVDYTEYVLDSALYSIINVYDHVLTGDDDDSEPVATMLELRSSPREYNCVDNVLISVGRTITVTNLPEGVTVSRITVNTINFSTVPASIGSVVGSVTSAGILILPVGLQSGLYHLNVTLSNAVEYTSQFIIE